MRDENDPATTAKAIIDANLYMVLGTADEGGHPWVSPVYYAPVDYREFIWVSRPETLHSHNLVGPASGQHRDLRLVGADRHGPGRLHGGHRRRGHR